MKKTVKVQRVDPMTEPSDPTYHTRAQAFIKDSKSKGYKVTAEDGQLIATPPKKQSAADRAFHKATQFGEHLKDTVVNDIKKVVNKVTGPSVRVSKMKDASLNDMARRARSGEYNQ